MSADPQELRPYGALIRDRRLACEWDQLEAYLAYQTAGGLKGYSTFVLWDQGKREPKMSDWDVIVDAFNPRLTELGKEDMLLQRVLVRGAGPTSGNVSPIRSANAKKSRVAPTKVYVHPRAA